MTDHLLEAFQLDAADVQTARDRTETMGGDVLGQLLVIGALSEEELLEQLARATELSAADPSNYARIDRDAFEALDDQVLREHAIIPFRKHRRSLAVFVTEPLDSEIIDALVEDHGVAISQFVWPRLRYEEALHSLLGEPLAQWLEPFLDQASHRVGFVEDTDAADGQGSDESAPEDTGGRIDVDGSMGAVDLDTLGVGWSRTQTLDFLSRCFDRDALLYTLLGFSAKWLDDRMVLVLGHERAKPYLLAGWPGLSDELRDLENLRRVKVDVPPDAVLFDEEQVGHSTAEMPEDVGLGQLFVELTLFPPDKLLVQTVRIGSRPSMAVIGKPHDGELPGVEPLEEAARAVGSQLEEIVRLAKARQLPPSDQRIPAIPEPDEDDFVEDEERPAVPGRAEESAHSPPIEPDKPGATAFGIPFADEADGDNSRSQKRSAVEVSSPGVGSESSVSIIAPIDIDEDEGLREPSEDGDVRTTMNGGFTADAFQQDLRRDGGGSTVALDSVVEEENSIAEESEPSEPPQDAEANKPQAPMAQILRPISLKKGRKKDDTELAEDSEAKSGDPDPAPDDGGEDPVEFADDEDLYADDADLELAGLPSIEIEAAVDDDEFFEEPGEANDEDEPGEMSQPVEVNQPGEPDEFNEAHEVGEPGSSPLSFSDDLEEIALKLDHAEPHASFAAAEQLASFGKPAMELLEARFPGRLLVDRYQYTKNTMPAVSEHGPVLAALAAAGSLAVPVVRSFLGHTSVELRFYATYLFTSLPVADALEDLMPRLFDRDHQTREIAKEIVLSRTDSSWLADCLTPALYDAIESGEEDLRIEVAADLLGAMRDRDSVPLLIEGLNRASGRVKDHVHAALRAITYKDFVPSASEWKNWWADAAQQERNDWVVAALNSNSVTIRNMVFDEVREFDDLDLNYHPDQPAKLRGRAQEDLRKWLQRS